MKQLCEGKDVEVRKIIKPLMSSVNEEKTESNKDVILTHNFMNSLTIALIEENLPQILPKHTQKILRMLDLENEITTYIEKNMIGMRGPRKYKKKTTSTESINKVTDVSMAEEENNEVNNAPTEIDEVNTQNENDEPENDNNEPENENNEPENENNETENENNEPENDNNEPEHENNEPETAENEDVDKKIEEPKSTESTEKVDPALLATPKAQQYFVKVLGQPSLPNRADAYKFFSSLNAVTIKKHKVIQNLLVVGFDNEQDYEKAVAASDTVVGNCKLIIKTNDKQALSTTTTPCKDKADSEKSEAMLTPDLENQITDLLTTIKQEQADTIENTESNTEQTKTEETNTEQPETKQSDSAANTDIVKTEIMTTDEANDDKTVDENSQTQELDETKNLETIKEDDEGNTESETNVANVKNVTAKGTPMKTRQSVATPRTIRTRRSSKLEQLNN